MEEKFERVIFALTSAARQAWRHRVVNLYERTAPFKVEEDLLFSPDFLALFRSAS